MRLGVRARLLLISLAVIALATAGSYAYLRGALDQWFTGRVRSDLAVRLKLVEYEASVSRLADSDQVGWDRLADDLGSRGEVRVTFMGLDGKVWGDSDVALARLPSVENHRDRPEIAAALRGRRGEAQRLSTTVGRRMLYMAIPFAPRGDFGGDGVARVAVSLHDVDSAVAGLSRIVAIATAIAIGLAALMSMIAAHIASRGARALTETARRMAAGDLGARTHAAGRDELAELGRTLDRMAESLQRTLTELRGERDLSGAVLDGMHEGVLLLGASGRVDLVNPALREMLLLDADVAGRSLLETVRHAELKELLDRALRDHSATSGEIEVGGLRPRNLLVRATPLTGRPGALLTVFVDVTDLKRLESLRRDFVANVSHELRTPIASVRSAAETLRSGALTDAEASGHFLGMIERNAQRLERLVEDLLELARIESRQARLDLAPVDVDEVLAQVLETHRARADTRAMTLGATVAPGAGRARADRRALEQVLSNLVDNAVKYGNAGGKVAVAVDHDENELCIAVSDDGPGIELRHLSRLFERFYRIDAGRSRDQGGTGLGLAIVKHLCEAMGGSVAVDSLVGRGTTFRVRLPRA